jgi:hypothetical protein
MLLVGMVSVSAEALAQMFAAGSAAKIAKELDQAMVSVSAEISGEEKVQA